MPIEDTAAPRPAPRLVLISATAFWMLYLLLWSLRSAVLSQASLASVGMRVIVSVASIGITMLFYLAMRRMLTARLGRSIVIAALLAAPAATAYAAVDWLMFDHLLFHSRIEWNWSSATASAPVGTALAQAQSDNGEAPLISYSTQVIEGYFFYVAWAGIYIALCYAAKIGTLQRRTAELRSARQSAELRALRYQVNPHFLFNTLNALSSLVMTGRKQQAEHMIINLATFFRASLTGDPTQDVSLGEEILLQKLYLDIETVRFPTRLVVDIDIPEELETACVPGLILQPLIENAVKYGVSRANRPVTVRICARTEAKLLLLTIEDDGETMPVEDGGTGVGLHNVRSRLAARFGDAARCEWGPRSGGGFSANLSLPLVRRAC